ncbi:MAG: HupE/UreJ family protein [Pontibacterium sp.]
MLTQAPYLTRLTRWLLILCVLIGQGMSQSALAHRMGESYLFIDYTQNSLHWDVEARLFDDVLDLDTSQNGIVSWPEYRAALSQIESFLSRNLQLKNEAQQPISFSLSPLKIQEIDQGTYLSTQLTLDTEVLSWRDGLTVAYSPFFDLDPSHLLLIKTHNESLLESVTTVTASQPQATLSQNTWWWASVWSLFKLGFEHMFLGLDHGVFLLVLTTALVFNQPKDTPRHSSSTLPSWRSIVRQTAWLVTFFSLGHGASLLANTFLAINPPSYWIELGIALSICLSASYHLRFNRTPKPTITFIFGLLHGFGFATSLSLLEFSPLTKLGFVTSFNVGIEIAQLFVAFLFILFLFLARLRSNSYIRIQRFIYLSTLAVGMYWFVVRL